MNTETYSIITRVFEKLLCNIKDYQLAKPLEFQSCCANAYMYEIGVYTKSFILEDFLGKFDVFITQVLINIKIDIKLNIPYKRNFRIFEYYPEISKISNNLKNDAFYDTEGHLKLEYNQCKQLSDILGLKVLAREDDEVFGFMIPNINELVKNDKSRNLS